MTFHLAFHHGVGAPPTGVGAPPTLLEDGLCDTLSTSDDMVFLDKINHRSIVVS